MIILSYLDSALLMALLLTTLSKRMKVICNFQVAVIIIGLFLPAVFISEMPLYQYIRAGIGDLSISTKIIAGLLLYQRATQSVVVSNKEWRVIITGAATFGLIFYPLALGLTMFDPYNLGYGATGLTVIVLLLAAVSIWKKFWLLSSIFILGLVAYYAGMLESNNLWDYLFDPILWLSVLTVACVTLWKKFVLNLKSVQP